MKPISVPISLPNQNLVAARFRRGGAGERLLEPVDRRADAGAGEMLLGVVDGRDDQPARRPGGDVAIEPTGRHRTGAAEDRLQLWRLTASAPFASPHISGANSS